MFLEPDTSSKIKKYATVSSIGRLLTSRAKRIVIGEMIRECKHHGLTAYVERQKRWRCKRCAVEAVTKRRRKVKRMLIEAAGGSCVRCGYDKCDAALQFHHRDRSEKSFALSAKQFIALEKGLEEIKKCDLLCANCHAEVEHAPVA